MSRITTHVLDVALGRPAGGVPISLSHQESGGAWREVGQGETDADGRLRSLLAGADTIPTGHYRLTFDVATYHARVGVDGFFPEVSISFHVRDGEQHYHVPLLLSPFGYSTYRGS